VPRYAYKLVPAQSFTSNWDEVPSAEAQLAAYLADEGNAGWHYPVEALTVKVWATGTGGRHKHASLSPSSGGTHVVVRRQI
jgi:hypothetical protein